jgi:hypothetical protein
VLAPWVEHATRGRRRAAALGDELLINVFKLCVSLHVWNNIFLPSITPLTQVNSLFGKFIESVERHFSSKLISSEEDCINQLGNPFLKTFDLLNDKTVLAQFYKEKTYMDRPSHLGVSILELSKVITYGYYYDVLKTAYGENVELLYTDTDSFVIRLFCKDLDEELRRIAHTLDTSNYRKENALYSSAFSKQLFYWKNEIPNSEILIFIALRAKCYMILTKASLEDLVERWEAALSSRGLDLNLEGSEIRNKGVAKSVASHMGIIPFLVSILSQSFISASFCKLQKINYRHHLLRINKKCLSFLDNKTQQKECFVHSVPYGYKESDLSCSCDIVI